ADLAVAELEGDADGEKADDRNKPERHDAGADRQFGQNLGDRHREMGAGFGVGAAAAPAPRQSDRAKRKMVKICQESCQESPLLRRPALAFVHCTPMVRVRPGSAQCHARWSTSCRLPRPPCPWATS